MSTAARGARISCLLIGLAALLAVLGLGAVAAQPAQAQASYAHGGMTDWDCGVCHLNGHPRETPVSEVCLTCHTGFSLPRRDLLCWTCHAPGEDMSRSRDNAACTSACHLPDGSIVTHTAHPDRSADCASCHAVSASPTDPAGSPHHTIPAPALDGLSPASGLPGVVVTLKGSHFANVVAVRFGDVDAAFVVDSLTQISAVVPATAITAPVRVLTAGGIATSSADFVVLRPEPLTLNLTVSRASLTLGGRVRLAGGVRRRGRATRSRSSCSAASPVCGGPRLRPRARPILPAPMRGPTGRGMRGLTMPAPSCRAADSGLPVGRLPRPLGTSPGGTPRVSTAHR